MSAALLVLLACCCSSSAGASAYFGGFIPGTPQFIAKKMKKMIQTIITGDAKPVDCENLYKYIKEIKGTPAAESASKSLTANEQDIAGKVYDIGRGVSPEKICDKSVIDSAIKLFKDVENAPEGEDVSGFCNEFKEINNDNENRPCLAYFLDTLDDISGTSGPVIAKCKEAGVDIS